MCAHVCAVNIAHVEWICVCTPPITDRHHTAHGAKNATCGMKYKPTATGGQCIDDTEGGGVVSYGEYPTCVTEDEGRQVPLGEVPLTNISCHQGRLDIGGA